MTFSLFVSRARFCSGAEDGRGREQRVFFSHSCSSLAAAVPTALEGREQAGAGAPLFQLAS